MTTQRTHAEGLWRSGTTAPGLLTVNQAAEFLGVSRWTIYKLVRDGKLRAVKAGERLRFRLADIDRYLERDAP